jgi:hypothetical protein
MCGNERDMARRVVIGAALRACNTRETRENHAGAGAAVGHVERALMRGFRCNESSVQRQSRVMPRAVFSASKLLSRRPAQLPSGNFSILVSRAASVGGRF